MPTTETHGMSDGEFVEKFVDPLIEDIYSDRQVLAMHRKRERIAKEIAKGEKK